MVWPMIAPYDPIHDAEHIRCVSVEGSEGRPGQRYARAPARLARSAQTWLRASMRTAQRVASVRAASQISPCAAERTTATPHRLSMAFARMLNVIVQEFLRAPRSSPASAAELWMQPGSICNKGRRTARRSQDQTSATCSWARLRVCSVFRMLFLPAATQTRQASFLVSVPCRRF